MRQLGSRTCVANVVLDGDFIASAGSAAVDLGDEDYGESLKICLCPQELDASEGAIGWWPLGRSGGEGADVNMIDEEVGIRRGENDNFDVAGVGSLGESLDEGGEVGCELIVPQVDGWVVDGCADNAAFRECRDGAIPRGGAAGFMRFGNRRVSFRD